MAVEILLIEDSAETCRLIASVMDPAEFALTAVSTARAGLAHLTTDAVDCVLLDYRLPDADGLACLRDIRLHHPETAVVIVTGEGSEEIAVEALKLGARDYVVKQGKWLLTVAVKVREALGRRHLEVMAARMRSELQSARGEVSRLQRALVERYRLDGIVGESAAMADALRQAECAARSRATVLLEGETGTGKELFARAIHGHGPRAGGPFQAINCAALPEALLEDELFGHVRGAFTGAERVRRGLFVETDGGTLFLDEVSETPAAVQAKLLRVVEDGIVRPVGGDTSRTVDVRLVAATNRNLLHAVEQGRFSRDLYHRLSVFPIQLPPLRERREDVRLLAAHFVHTLAQREGKRLRGFEPAALRVLEAYTWPGNVRELRNEIHRAVIRADDGARVTLALLTPAIVAAVAPADAPAADRTLRELQREFLTHAIADRLRRYGNRRTVTARSLGVSREWLWAMMRRLRIGVGA